MRREVSRALWGTAWFLSGGRPAEKWRRGFPRGHLNLWETYVQPRKSALHYWQCNSASCHQVGNLYLLSRTRHPSHQGNAASPFHSPRAFSKCWKCLTFGSGDSWRKAQASHIKLRLPVTHLFEGWFTFIRGDREQLSLPFLVSSCCRLGQLPPFMAFWVPHRYAMGQSSGL